MQPSVIEITPEKEIWRDESIDYMIDVFNGNIEADYDSLNAITTAMHDARVRDVVLYFLSRMDEEELSRALMLLTKALTYTKADKRAPVATCLSLAYGMIGLYDECVLANSIALIADIDYSLANLVKIMLDHEGTPELFNDMMDKLTYDTCRYGDES